MKTKQKIAKIIVKYWNGKGSLAIAFWIIGNGGLLIIGIANILFAQYCFPDPNDFRLSLLLIFFIIYGFLGMIYYAASVQVVWRCANNSKSKLGNLAKIAILWPFFVVIVALFWPATASI
jgi:hypothetical protein